MEPPKDTVPPGEPDAGGPRESRPGLVKCPHCGRFVPADARRGVPREGPGASAPVFKCPACGLEIRGRHLA